MKTVVFFKTIDIPNDKGRVQIDKKAVLHFLQVTPLATSYDKSSEDRLYRLESEVYTAIEIIAKYGSFGLIIKASEALVLGQSLKPDRDIIDIKNPNGPKIPYHFGAVESKVTMAELKKQCEQDISELEEAKAQTLIAMRADGDTLSNEDETFILNFKTARTSILNQYNIDKGNLGFNDTGV